MNRADVTEMILAARRQKKLSWAKLAAMVGHSKEWSTAALDGARDVALGRAQAAARRLGDLLRGLVAGEQRLDDRAPCVAERIARD